VVDASKSGSLLAALTNLSSPELSSQIEGLRICLHGKYYEDHGAHSFCWFPDRRGADRRGAARHYAIEEGIEPSVRAE